MSHRNNPAFRPITIETHTRTRTAGGLMTDTITTSTGKGVLVPLHYILDASKLGHIVNATHELHLYSGDHSATITIQNTSFLIDDDRYKPITELDTSSFTGVRVFRVAREIQSNAH